MGEETQEEINNRKYYDVLLKERELLIDAAREGARSFDKAILTLTAGAFGISLTFINDIDSKFDPNTICFLISSWTLFGFGILSTLISFIASYKACLRQIEILDDTWKNKTTNGEKNIWNQTTQILNIFSIVTFILGIGFLTYFVSVNLIDAN